MKIHEVEQGSAAWFAVRAGLPTASCFKMIITGGGKRSTQADKYQNLLLYELMRGEPNPEGYKSKSMETGNLREDDAAQIYSARTGIEPMRVGFVTDDMMTMGASPDRLLGEDGLLEIKSPEPQTHIGYLLDEKLDDEYKPQCQGQLLVTGRKWLDIISYEPSVKPFVKRVVRDEPYLAEMRKLLKEFHAGMMDKKQILISKGYSFHDLGRDIIPNYLDAC